MRAEILSIGTELLLGEVIDTNSAWLAARLADLGHDVYWSQRVGDNLTRATEALQRAMERSDLIITSGGLGSTDDDLTRQVVATAMGEEMFVDDAALHRLKDFYQRARYPFTALIERQAMRIPSARILENPVGTAPGWMVTRPDRPMIVTLPGPPRELCAMWDNEVAPRLPCANVAIHRRVIKTLDIGEVRVFELLEKEAGMSNPTLATYASADGVHVRVAARAADNATARALTAPVVERVREVLAPCIWGYDNDELPAVIAQRLREKCTTVATVESVTGGRLAAAFTAVAGVSDVFVGGAVPYWRESKIRLGVPASTIDVHGVVSEETARAMAQATRMFFESTWAVATTGVAGPADLEGASVGTVCVAVAGPSCAVSRSVSYATRDRAQIQERATWNALSLLWKLLAQGAD